MPLEVKVVELTQTKLLVLEYNHSLKIQEKSSLSLETSICQQSSGEKDMQVNQQGNLLTVYECIVL